MVTTENSIDLFHKLQNSWSKEHALLLAKELIQLFKNKSDTGSAIGLLTEEFLFFSLDLSHLHLRGMGNANPAIILKYSSKTEEQLKHLVRRLPCENGLPFVFCMDNNSYTRACSSLSRRSITILSPRIVANLLTSDNPTKVLTKHLQDDLGRYRLNPYDILHPVSGNTFFGRHRELSQLVDDSHHSFAIAGPGQIGKSSLLKQYKWKLNQLKDPRAQRLHLVDFYDLEHTDDDSITEHLAFSIEKTKRTYEMKCKNLPEFLKRLSAKDEGTPELLLDEVDRVCNSRVFDLLGHEAKQGNVRLIIAGKRNLLDLMLHEKSSFKGRLRLMRLQPLDSSSSWDVITSPMNMLGIQFKDSEQIIKHLLIMSGRLPCLLQFYCNNIVEWSIEHHKNVITLDDIHAIESGDFSLNILGPLLEMPSDLQKLALTLCASSKDGFTIPQIQTIADSLQLKSDLKSASNFCMELLIQNILTLDKDHYWISNRAIPHFAQRAGLIKPQSL